MENSWRDIILPVDRMKGVSLKKLGLIRIELMSYGLVRGGQNVSLSASQHFILVNSDLPPFLKALALNI